MPATYSPNRPRSSKRRRKGLSANSLPKRGTMPPPTKTPPRAPRVTAKLPAAVPNRAQKTSTVSRHKLSLPSSAPWVISGACRAGACTPCNSAKARWIKARPGPESKRSKETWENSRHACRKMAISRSSRGEKLVWPPSVPRAIQPSPAGIKPETPRPEPEPSSPITLLGKPSPPPICARSFF